MSLLHKTDVYRSRHENVSRKRRDYGLVLALLCVQRQLSAAVKGSGGASIG